MRLILCGIGLGLLCSCAKAPDPISFPAPTKSAYLRIADEVDANLQREILEKFFPVTVDEQGGGFFENYDAHWARKPSTGKSIVYQSRLTWTSAKAALRFPGQTDMYLTMTRRGATCLAEEMWDKQGGGFHWRIKANGQPDSPIKQLYGHAFGIYALVASYEVTHDQAALDLAKKAFLWMEDYAHDNEHLGYFEAIGPDGKRLTSSNSIVGARPDQKSMNTSIHILEALTGLYHVWPDPLLKTRTQEMLDLCRDRIYSEPGYLSQYLTLDWQRTSSPDSFGHDVEAGYLMIEAADALGQGDDARNWTMARHLVDHAMQYGWDSARGGLYESGALAADGSISGDLSTDKTWWVQAEHLNALLLQHERAGHETSKYWEAFVREWNWIKTFQIDHKSGGWFPVVEADGTPISRSKGDLWTECYHQARAMMNVSDRLRKLAADEK